MIKRITSCRVCHNEHLTDVIDLGQQYLQGQFVKDGINPPLRKIPLIATLCDPEKSESACGLLQLRHTVPPEILYRTYWYRSGTNLTMTRHLADIARRVNSIIPRPAMVLDIGCNDGTFLKFLDPSIERIGIDPSNVTHNPSDHIHFIHDFFPCEATKSIRADVITSFAMFYDLDSPVDFAHHVKESLTADGLWIFEVAYLPSMLKNNSFDTICHEHLEYYSLSSLEAILDKVDMCLIKAELNSINGGSILCAAVNKSSILSYEVDSQNLSLMRQEEFDLSLDQSQTYSDFQIRINKVSMDLYKFLLSQWNNGSKIHIYGASTKGNVLIQASGISQFIEYAAERNESKWGARTLGTNIPIVSEAESRAMRPNYYLVLPWHFKSEFLSREREAWKGFKVKPQFIFPLPTLEILSLD